MAVLTSRFWIGLPVVLALSATAPAHSPSETEIPWNVRTIEHLFNRAGFGVHDSTLGAFLRKTPEETVDWLLQTRVEPPKKDLVIVEMLTDEAAGEMGIDREEFKRRRMDARLTDNNQFWGFSDWWYGSLIRGSQPLADRMTMFWLGFFPVSTQTVMRRYEVIQQHDLIREHGMGNFRELLDGIAHDPAMIWFLDNDTNIKGHPNENLGRELLELFSLGEGNYTEVDVREVARALTGLAHDRPTASAVFRSDLHDDGEKTVLTASGEFKSPEVVDIILKQEACSVWVMYKLISYMEGVAPKPKRLNQYAKFFRDVDYELKPVLRKLLLDPEFYRDEVVGARVQSPMDYLVGSLRRLGATPSPNFMYKAGLFLGQGLFDPPSVEGWKENESWINNDDLLQRGNVLGVLLGVFDGAELDESQRSVADQIQKFTMVPGHFACPMNITSRMLMTGLRDDEMVVAWLLEELLASEPSPDLLPMTLEFLADLRAERGHEGTPFVELGDDLDPILRRIVHLILSLPDAHLG